MRVQKDIVRAAVRAHAKLSQQECDFLFHLGQEAVGRNSRQLLSDGSIYWIGRRKFVRPPGPFDPGLPVLAFREPHTDTLLAVLFNHSKHTIGTIKPGVRSPSFYGLAAQRFEQNSAENSVSLREPLDQRII